MSDLATVRAQLASALEVVLPGRVQPFPPTTRRHATPSIFIEQASIVPTGDGIVGTFPVWVLVDGTVQAQIAAHDDIVWNAWLAVWPFVDRVDAAPQWLAGLRATVLACDVTLDVATLCAPSPAAAAEIPPVTLGSP